MHRFIEIREHRCRDFRRQKREEYRLQLQMFFGDQHRQLAWFHPLQARHPRAALIAVDAVDHAAGDLGAERFVKNALQHGSRCAVDPALFAELIKEVIDHFARHAGFHAGKPRHVFAQAHHFFAAEFLHHRRRRFFAQAQQQDRRLFQVAVALIYCQFAHCW